jgi:hypothetical protein
MVVIEYFMAGAAVLIGQGIYTLRTGDIRPLGFLIRPSSYTAKSKRSSRLAVGVFFIACGLWVLHVPFFATLRAVPLASWVSGHTGPLLAAAFCGGIGIFLLAWPVAFLTWLRSYYPQLPAAERWALLVPRGIGVGALVIAIQILAGILYYTGAA